MIEDLEQRRLLSGSAAIDGNGILQIDGTSGDDQITLTVDNIAQQLDVDINMTITQFDLSAPLFTAINITADDGNDVVSLDSAINFSTSIDGGVDPIPGDDGDDIIHGEAGNDTIDGGAGSDQMFGDDNKDTVTYASRTNDVSVTLDGVANDGESGQDDLVDDSFEVIIGGSGNDTIDASASVGPRELLGEDGNDTIIGENGNDLLD